MSLNNFIVSDTPANVLLIFHHSYAYFYAYRNFLFGAGRRVCTGETLAKNRIFLFIACLLQKFKFLPVKGEKVPNHDPRTYRFAFTLMINDYEVIAKPRSREEY